MLVGVAIGQACASSDPPVCEEAACIRGCNAENRANTGRCDRGACLCFPIQEADADGEGDVPRDADLRREDGIAPDDATIPEAAAEGGGGAKSSCDPVVCFLACGGTCRAGGECSCPQ